MAEAKTKVMKIHELCRIFSKDEAMTQAEIDRLREDIKEHGVRVPILVNKKKDTILDGRTRWMLATELGKQDQVKMDVFTGKDEDIKLEIFSRNILRRHLDAGQRASLAEKLFGKQFEAEAKEEQRKAGRATAGKERDAKVVAFKKGDGEESVAEKFAKTHAGKLAKTAGVSKHAAQQAINAEKAGLTDDVIQKKISARSASRKGATKKRKPAKEKSLEDRVWLAFDRMMRSKTIDRAEQTAALKILRGFIDDILRTRDKKIERNSK